MLRNLLVPLDELVELNHVEKYRLYKLRGIFYRVRLLCMVALDAYHSHHPVRCQLPSALLNLPELIMSIAEESDFLALLRQTAGWLADEIYLHPKATAVLRQYELDGHRKIAQKYKLQALDKDRLINNFPNFLWNGLGQPNLRTLVPLLRLSFESDDFKRYSSSSCHQIRKYLEKRLGIGPGVAISVIENHSRSGWRCPSSSICSSAQKAIWLSSLGTPTGWSSAYGVGR